MHNNSTATNNSNTHSMAAHHQHQHQQHPRRGGERGGAPQQGWRRFHSGSNAMMRQHAPNWSSGPRQFSMQQGHGRGRQPGARVATSPAGVPAPGPSRGGSNGGTEWAADGIHLRRAPRGPVLGQPMPTPPADGGWSSASGRGHHGNGGRRGGWGNDRSRVAPGMRPARPSLLHASTPAASAVAPNSPAQVLWHRRHSTPSDTRAHQPRSAETSKGRGGVGGDTRADARGGSEHASSSESELEGGEVPLPPKPSRSSSTLSGGSGGVEAERRRWSGAGWDARQRRDPHAVARRASFTRGPRSRPSHDDHDGWRPAPRDSVPAARGRNGGYATQASTSLRQQPTSAAIPVRVAPAGGGQHAKHSVATTAAASADARPRASYDTTVAAASSSAPSGRRHEQHEAHGHRRHGGTSSPRRAALGHVDRWRGGGSGDRGRGNADNLATPSARPRAERRSRFGPAADVRRGQPGQPTGGHTVPTRPRLLASFAPYAEDRSRAVATRPPAQNGRGPNRAGDAPSARSATAEHARGSLRRTNRPGSELMRDPCPSPASSTGSRSPTERSVDCDARDHSLDRDRAVGADHGTGSRGSVDGSPEARDHADSDSGAATADEVADGGTDDEGHTRQRTRRRQHSAPPASTDTWNRLYGDVAPHAALGPRERLEAQLDANIKRTEEELARLDELLQDHEEHRGELRVATANGDASAAGRHGERQTDSAGESGSVAVASVAKTLDFSEPAVSATGAKVASIASRAPVASADTPVLKLDREDEFVLRQPRVASVAALKAVAVVAAAATAKPAAMSLLRLRPKLTEDARAAVAAVLLENRSRAFLASQPLLAVSHLPPERVRESEALRAEARAKAAARLGGELKVAAALGGGINAAMLALHTPFLASGSPLSLPEYLRPCEAPGFKENVVRHNQIKGRVAAVVAARKRLLDEREEQLASRYLKQRAAWRKRVAALEKRQQREDSTQRVGSRRSRDVRDAGMFALDGGNSLNLARFGGALLSDLEEKQVMEMLAERERREAVRQATIMTATVAQLPPEVREAQKVINNNARFTVDGGPPLCAGRAPDDPCPVAPCNCARAMEDVRKHVNPWTDMEKLIFVDKFLQYPKNFHKVATFLANKTCKDCVAFYYDSKKLTNYKVLLREQTTALRRRMARTSWPLTLRAARELGVQQLPAASSAKMQRATAIRMPDYTFSALPTAQDAAQQRSRSQSTRRRAEPQLGDRSAPGRAGGHDALSRGRHSPPPAADAVGRQQKGGGATPTPAASGAHQRRRRHAKRRGVAASPPPDGDTTSPDAQRAPKRPRLTTPANVRPRPVSPAPAPQLAVDARASPQPAVDAHAGSQQPAVGARSSASGEMTTHSGPLTHSIAIAASSLGGGATGSRLGDHHQLKQILASLQSKPGDKPIAARPAAAASGLDTGAVRGAAARPADALASRRAGTASGLSCGNEDHADRAAPNAPSRGGGIASAGGGSIGVMIRGDGGREGIRTATSPPSDQGQAAGGARNP